MNGERCPKLPSQVLEHDLEGPSETIADTSSLLGSTSFQFTPYRTPDLPTSLFVASQETIHVNSIVALMHETNIPRQDRINITEAMVYIASTLGTFSFQPMSIPLTYSTFFTELLTHENGRWNGIHIISNAAREFLI